MFGASAVRKKRERERREKEARGSEPIIFPYIKVLTSLNKASFFYQNELTLLLSDFVLTSMMVLDDLQKAVWCPFRPRGAALLQTAPSRGTWRPCSLSSSTCRGGACLDF